MKPITENGRLLAQQIATNAVGVFANRIHGRALLTFQDVRIAKQIESILCELAPINPAVDQAVDATTLGIGDDSVRSTAVDAVARALEPAREQSQEQEEQQPDDGGEIEQRAAA